MGITKQELAKISELQRKLEIIELKDGLTEFNDKTNPNYKFLYNAIKDQEYERYIDEVGEASYRISKGYAGVILSGSSRSGKTISWVDIVIWLCTMVETACEIIIVRDTYNSMKTTIFKDFKMRLDDFGLDNPFHRSKEVPSFKIGKNQIHLIGADDDSKVHGATSDYIFFNELLHINVEVFRQLTMRCNKFWMGDFNPSVTQHYVFDSVIPRYDVGYLRTTFQDNAYLSIAARNELLAFEPWERGSYDVINEKVHYLGQEVTSSHQPPPHKLNIKQGTADVQQWKIYGLGLRGAMQGVIFRNVDYVKERPDFGYSYGLDFGYTNDPSVLTRNWENATDIWIEYLTYSPTDTAAGLNALMEALKIEKDIPITADSSDRFTSQHKGTVEMVRELREYGWEIFKVSKKKSIMYWLSSMKSKNIHVIVNEFSDFAKKEFENYKFKEIQGLLINQPIDGYDHGITSARYRHMDFNSNGQIEVDWS